MRKLSFNFKLTGLFFINIFLFISTSLIFAQSPQMDTNVPYGWCINKNNSRSSSLSEQQFEGTTGGNNGRIVHASSRSDLNYLCMSEEPLVIYADGEYGHITLAPNKTIIGKVHIGGGPGTSARSFSPGSNTIIRNFNIRGGDGIAISGGKSHIWIDHCTFYDCGDEQLSMTNGADRVSVTWCRFFDKEVKVMLICSPGSKGSNPSQRYNLTISHCIFDSTDQRMPRIGYGKCHVLNSYYKNVGHIPCPGYDGGYGIHIWGGARVCVERNYFLNTPDAASPHGPASDKSGSLYYIDNIRDSISKFYPAETDSSKIFWPDNYYMHDFAIIDAKDVPEIVGKGAGVGKEYSTLGLLPTPSQGEINVSRNPTLKWTKAGSRAANTVYFGKTFPPTKKNAVTGNSFQPGNLEEGTVYYWRVNDNDVWYFRTAGTVQPRELLYPKKPTQIVSVNSNSNPNYEGLSIYLNPIHSELKLKLNDSNSGTGSKDLILYDCLGKVIRKETALGNEHTMHIKTLPRGVYYISLFSKQGKIVRKFIKN